MLNISAHSVVNFMTEGLVIHDKSGTVIGVNAAALSILRISESDIVGKKPSDHDWPLRRLMVSYDINRDSPSTSILKNSQTINNRLYQINFGENEKRWILLNSVPSSQLKNATDNNHIVTTFTDITELHESQLRERQMNERLATAIEAVRFGVWDWNLKTGSLVWDAMMYSIFEIDKSDFQGDYDAFEKTLHPEDAPRVQAELNQAFEKREIHFETYFRVISKNKGIKDISAKAKCFYDSDGKIDRVIGCNWDLSEKLAQQKIISQQREKLIAVYNGSRDAVMLLDDTGFFECNPSTLELFHVATKEEFCKLHPSQLSPEFQPNGKDSLSESEHHIQKALKEGMDHFEWMHRTHKGIDFPAEVLLSAFDYGGTKILQATVRNITERKFQEQNIELQRQKLVMSSKMASLGEMAGSIAHEINNPLAIIQGKANQTRRMIEAGKYNIENIKEDLRKIEVTSDRIAKIVRGLRSFSRNTDSDPLVSTSIKTVIEDTLELCKERFKNHAIELKVSCEVEASALCRPAQISQVLMNLLNNAHDAVENLGEKWISILVFTQGNKLTISVSDSGKGISKEVADKMMMPFYTTKELGKGTGLGLSISMAIVQDHGGTLTYDASAPNTTFLLTLPIA